MKSQAVTFENPPINEVVVSTYFNPQLVDLQPEHIGLFWGEIKEDFPSVHQQPPVGDTTILTSRELFPMPRYWFIAEDGINLIQIQRNAFMFNWRRRKDEYPGFHNHIKPAFDKYYDIFSEFIRREIKNDLSVDLCELAYVNTLERCEYWSGPQDTMKVIPSFSIMHSGIDASESLWFNRQDAYEVSSGLQLNIGIRSGVVREQQQNTPALVFEIKAGGRPGRVEKPKADRWFERAHDAITQCFLGITSRDIQDHYWKPAKATP